MNLDDLSREELEELLELSWEMEDRIKRRYIDRMYPDEGTNGHMYGFDDAGNALQPQDETWSRHMYGKHLQFFEAGPKYTFRLFMAANRIGKTLAAGYELTCHLTGVYPHWWRGRRFNKPIDVWVVGVDSKSLREVIQDLLLGKVGTFGTGMIPYDAIDFDSLKDAKKADAGISTMRIKSEHGGYSVVNFKAYESGRDTFQGTAKDVIWMDEEPPEGIFEECAMRVMTTNGMVMMTFTPLKGLSELVHKFFDEQPFGDGPIGDTKYCTMATWDDVPHLTKKLKDAHLARMPEYERAARSKGIPALGSGVVYGIDPDLIFINPIPIPTHWERVAAIDFGWEDPTAILWGAISPDGICYVYSEHYMTKTPYAIHASAIEERNRQVGYKIPMVCDPSGGGRSSTDGRQVREQYIEMGIKMKNAKNAIVAGHESVRHKMNNGTLKIFNTCTNVKQEQQKYCWDDGKLKGSDHAMDALRYLIVSGLDIAEGPPKHDEFQGNRNVSGKYRGQY